MYTGCLPWTPNNECDWRNYSDSQWNYTNWALHTISFMHWHSHMYHLPHDNFLLPLVKVSQKLFFNTNQWSVWQLTGYNLTCVYTTWLFIYDYSCPIVAITSSTVEFSHETENSALTNSWLRVEVAACIYVMRVWINACLSLMQWSAVAKLNIKSSCMQVHILTW